LTPLNLIYAIKICLGAFTAIICLLLGVDNLLTGATVGLLVYLAADRVLKQVFMSKVEKQSAVTKTGIGIYIITWLFLWILLFTFLYTPAP